MAVSKSTRTAVPDTSQLIQKIFRNSKVSEERRREWQQAQHPTEAGPSSLRFPVYEDLYLLNLSAQKLVDLLKGISRKFGLAQEESLCHQFLIEQVRSAVSCDVVEHMAAVEHTDAWVFESLRRVEEKKLREPDDVYYLVREREEERAKQRLPPLVRFLDEKASTSKAKSRK
jgi:hypothetical protein